MDGEFLVKAVSDETSTVQSTPKGLRRHLSDGGFSPPTTRFSAPKGVSFPVSPESWPSGMGHTIISDSSSGLVRSLSLRERWSLQGGMISDYPADSPSIAIANRVLVGAPPALKLYLAGLGLGSYFSLCSHEDYTNDGSNLPWSVSPLLYEISNARSTQSTTRREQE